MVIQVNDLPPVPAELEEVPNEKPYVGLPSTEFRVIERVFTVEELAASRKPGIRQRQGCLNVAHGKDDLYGESGRADVGKLATGRIYTAQEVIDIRHDLGAQCRFVLLNEEMLGKEPPMRKMDIEKHLHHLLVSLLKQSPTNPVGRAHLMAIFGQLPPEELTTYEQVRDWVEFKFNAPKWKDDRQRRNYGVAEASAIPRPPERHSGMIVAVQVEANETGTCRYTATYISNFPVMVPDEIIRLWVQRGYSFERMVDELRGNVETRAGETDPGGDASNYEYEDHSANLLNDRETIIRGSPEDLLSNHLRNLYGPEEAQEIIDRG